MPIFAMTKKTKRDGLQTFAAAQGLPSGIREHELDYLSVREMYTNLVARKAQFDEALHQAKAAGDSEDIRLFSDKIHGLETGLVDLKRRVKAAGEKSFAEAVMLSARSMLSKEAWSAIEQEAERLIGRGAHELRGTK